MSVVRKKLWKNRQFVTIDDLSLLESLTAYDFEAESRIASQSTRIVYGFNVAGVVGKPVSTLTLSQSGCVVGGGILYVPSKDGVLSGSWVPNTTNYITLEFLTANSDDVVTYAIKSGKEVAYETDSAYYGPAHYFTVSSYLTGGIPLAAVVTDATNNIVSVTDIRPLMFDAIPDSSAITLDKFKALPTATGQISSYEDAIKTLITKNWMQGGQFWYSPSVDAHSMHVYGDWSTSAESASDITWTDARILFDNAAGWYNIVAAGTANLTVDGACLYVDIDRSSNATVSAQVGTLPTLGMPATDSGRGPGDRIVLAWRSNGKKYVRGQNVAVGGQTSIATIGTYGTVKLNVPKVGSDTLAAVVDQGSKAVVAAGLTRGILTSQGEGAAGSLKVGPGQNDTAVEVGGIYTDDITLRSNTKVLDTKSTVGSGDLIDIQNSGVSVAKVSFNGTPVEGTHIIVRSEIGWGIGRITGTLSSTATQTSDTAAAAMTFTTSDADAITVFITEA